MFSFFIEKSRRPFYGFNYWQDNDSSMLKQFLVVFLSTSIILAALLKLLLESIIYLIDSFIIIDIRIINAIYWRHS